MGFIQRIKRAFIRFLIRYNLAIFPALFFFIRLRKISMPNARKGALKILALNAQRFRGDLENLSETGDAVIYTLNFEDQTRFFYYFYQSDSMNIVELMHSDAHELKDQQKAYQNFITDILRYLKRWLGLDIMVSTNPSYIQDYDWTIAAHTCGIKVFILLRGGLITCTGFERDIIERFKTYGSFAGDMIITHNHKIRDVLLHSGFAQDHQLRVLGATRMEKFMRRIENYQPPPAKNRKQIALFSFPHAAGLFAKGMFSEDYDRHFDGVWSRDNKEGFVELFHAVHSTFIACAIENPDIDVIIKLKWGGTWAQRILDLIAEQGMRAEDIPNLEINHQGNPHDIILASDVVCAYGSTTVMEAAIAGKPVILPLFAETERPEYKDYVMYAGLADLFDTVRSETALKETIVKRLKDPYIPQDITEKRIHAFHDYVSLTQSGIAQHCIETMREALK